MPRSTPALARTGLNDVGRAVVIGLVLLALGLGAFAYAWALNQGGSRREH